MPHYFDTDERETIRAVSAAPATTTAFCLDTDREHTAGDLLEFKNNGTGVASVAVGGGGVYLYFPNGDGYSEIGKGEDAGFMDITSPNGDYYAGFYIDNARGSELYLSDTFFSPDTSDGNSAFDFNTSIKHTYGDLLRVRNKSNTVFVIGVSGETRLTPMTKAIRSGISPTSGTIIFQSDNTPGFRFYDGTNWIRLSGVFDN